ncbi:PEGA domain-containing protein [Candidatus Pyrohabitans sp.]
MRWFVIALVSLLSLVSLHALPAYPVDEVVIGVNTTTGMELSLFQYKSGYAHGIAYGLERRGVVELQYPASFFSGDVDGDGVDEIIRVVRKAQGTALEIYRYDREENKLLRLDIAFHGSEAGEWLAGDINGDGVDELILIQPGVAWTEIYAYVYDPAYSRGTTEKLRQLDILRYGGITTWLTGDVNGDGVDELIAFETLPQETRFAFFLYDTSYIRDMTEKLNRIGEARYAQILSAWLAGDVDGDGVDELVGVDYEYYETRLVLMRYEPGYSYGTSQGFRRLEVLRYTKAEPLVFLGNVESALRVLSRQPSSEKLTVKQGEEVQFAVEAEHTDGVKVSYLWRLNGIDVSRDGEFTYTSKLGPGVVECIVSAPLSGEATLTWRVDVAEVPQRQEVREEEKENTPPEVTIVSPPAGAKASGEVEVRWLARDADGDPLTVRVELVSGGEATTLYEGREAEGSYVLNVSSFEAGSYLLRAVVNDGSDTASDEVVFEVYRKAAEERGLLALSSIPPGAEIYIDDRLAGVTDAEVYLPPGSYRVRLEKAGYMPYETEVEVFSGRSTSIEARLVKKIFGLPPALFFIATLVAMGVVAFLLYLIAGFLRQRMRAPREELEESITKR